jgi:2-dehydropantoate 2-reductase
MDIAIIMVKATQTDAAMNVAAPCIGPNTVVVTLQNGLETMKTSRSISRRTG